MSFVEVLIALAVNLRSETHCCTIKDAKYCVSHWGYNSLCMVLQSKGKVQNNVPDKTLKAFLFKVIMISIYAY